MHLCHAAASADAVAGFGQMNVLLFIFIIVEFERLTTPRITLPVCLCVWLHAHLCVCYTLFVVPARVCNFLCVTCLQSVKAFTKTHEMLRKDIERLSKTDRYMHNS